MTSPSAGVPAPSELTGAVGLARGFAEGSRSPVEALQDALDATARLNGSVNAMLFVDEESAMEQARAAEARWRAGAPLSLADGLPVSIKDVLLTRGWPTFRGSMLVDADGDWIEDAPAVARLRESGAVIFGKNTVPEFAWKGVTDSIRHGSTGNPWGAELTSGGSSGGAATAVGLGMGAWSVGTDGGGSVRIPAAFTGTVALKPTFGLVPTYPASPFGTLSHAGPMTRSVQDAAFMMDVIAGPDPRDWFALAPVDGSFMDGLEDGVEGIRLAYSPTLSGLGVNDVGVDAAVRAAVDCLSDLGAVVEEVDPPLAGYSLAEITEAFHILWFSGAGKVLEAFGTDGLAAVDPLLGEMVGRYATATASDYLGATQVRMDLGIAFGGFHEDYAALLTPTVPIPAFERGRDTPAGWPSDLWTSWTPYTFPFNMTGQPALSVPCGFTDDKPVGLQIVGPRHGDRLVLRVGRAYERATDWHSARPILVT